MKKKLFLFWKHLGNQLFGGRKRFAVGHQLSSKTEYISILASNYLGIDECFTLIDTPGAKDTLGMCLMISTPPNLDTNSKSQRKPSWTIEYSI